jgi:hypothetical protein
MFIFVVLSLEQEASVSEIENLLGKPNTTQTLNKAGTKTTTERGVQQWRD